MAARICPHCRTRVDERRAAGSPYCLRCGAPLGTPPPAGFGKQPAQSSALPWILGGIGLFMVLAIGGGVLFLIAVANAAPEKPTPTLDDPTSVPNLEVPTAVATPNVTTVSPIVLGAFPRARAQNEVDRVANGLASCKRAGDPTGRGSIRVDFEPGGRVGTLLQRPFSGTPTGSCISGRFLAIKIGAFTGTTQPITKTFTIAGGATNPGF